MQIFSGDDVMYFDYNSSADFWSYKPGSLSGASCACASVHARRTSPLHWGLCGLADARYGDYPEVMIRRCIKADFGLDPAVS